MLIKTSKSKKSLHEDRQNYARSNRAQQIQQDSREFQQDIQRQLSKFAIERGGLTDKDAGEFFDGLKEQSPAPKPSKLSRAVKRYHYPNV